MASKQASGSGQEIKDPVYGPPREESNAAATATAAAETPQPSPAPPVEDLHGRVHERPGDGGGSPSPAAVEEAAAAADRKGKKVAATSPSSSSSPPRSAGISSRGSRLPPVSPVVPVSRGKESSIAEAVDSARGVRVSWKEPVAQQVVAVRKAAWPIDLKDVFEGILREQEAIKEEDLAEEEEMKKQEKGQVEPPTLLPEKKNLLLVKVKGAVKNRVLKRIRRQRHHYNRNSTFTKPHVDHSIINMRGIIKHYGLLEMVAGQGKIFHSNALLLCCSYSGFRPVLGDGECFYRSFIFSYLEQVLDRQDTHEEYRLLAAVKEVGRQHARLGWTSEFSNSRKAFKKMIKKIMRWKRHGRWKRVPTTNSYRRDKLLQFFSGYDTTKHIFSFLRLVAAIWICSHREEYEPRVSDLREDYTLRDWCFQVVIPERIDVDHIQMTALVTALGVPLRVEDLFQGLSQDLYTVQDPEDNVPRRMCWPRPRRHRMPPGHKVPHVSVLFSTGHYDIIYPSIGEGCSRGTGPGRGESSTATGGSSSSQ